MPCHELVKGYNSDPGMDHMTAVELILSRLRNFLDYGGGKRVRRKGYDDASLTPIRIALSRETGYI